tara:strand:+ start:1152 stop:2465 length:1314 start_codon:yes stop_codon:yes gene_type:complete
MNSLITKSITEIHKLRNILYTLNVNGSRIVKHTPLQLNKRLSVKYGVNVYLKREDLQPIRSFKIRGAASRILALDKDKRNKGVVCASAGNHAQGVAQTCSALNMSADIFIPTTTPTQKIRRIEHFNNTTDTIHKVGNNFQECLKASLEFSKQQDKSFIHPYNHLDTISGQSTIALEIFDDLQETDYIISPVGGGGLISGLSSCIDSNESNCKIIGAEPDTCPSLTNAIKHGKPTFIECTDDFVDGASVSTVGNINFDICKDLIHSVELVDIGHLCTTMLDLYQEDGIIAEPAGALSVAALDTIFGNKNDNKYINDSGSHFKYDRNTNVVCVISGGNNDLTRYPDIMERSLKYQRLKYYFVVEFNQTPGELLRWVKTVLGPSDDITRFEYIKKTENEYGVVLIGVQVQNKYDIIGIEQRMVIGGFTYSKIDKLWFMCE